MEGVNYKTCRQIMTNFYRKNLTKGKPPNVPHLCPIENYWAALKRAVYAGGYQAKSLDALKRLFRAKIREVDQHLIFNLFRSIKATFIKTAEDPYATFKWIDSFLFNFLLSYAFYELYLIDIHFIVQYAIVSPLK